MPTVKYELKINDVVIGLYDDLTNVNVAIQNHLLGLTPNGGNARCEWRKVTVKYEVLKNEQVVQTVDTFSEVQSCLSAWSSEITGDTGIANWGWRKVNVAVDSTNTNPPVVPNE
jgi:hypothetical protein